MQRIILVQENEMCYMTEYIATFSKNDTIVQYTNQTAPFTENCYYLCIRRVPFGLLPTECKIGFVNTEQLTIPVKFEEYKTFAKEGVDVFDYSLKNIEISGKGIYLPYNEVLTETETLRACMVEPKQFNIGVIGTYTKYRDGIVASLRRTGFTVDFICEFGKTRDIRMGKCSVLLNLHASLAYSLYESVRCERWRFAGMPIVTESCTDCIPDGVNVSTDLIATMTERFGKPAPPTCTIGLCMIVKNEHHIIHEVLEATKDIIDTYCILDTGSTDDTVQIIRDFYAKTDIKGVVVEGDWKGFGPSRSESLKLCDGKMDYIIVIDADDLMVFPKGGKEFLKKTLLEHMPNSCSITIKRGTLDYMRTQIFKANDDWRYVGVLHEYPTNDKPNNKTLKLPIEIHMIGRCLGSRSLEEGSKYAKDAAVLLAALESEPDNERYVFYLAQSYRDAGMRDEAVMWYKKRVAMGKWVEEVYVSALNISRLTNDKDWAWKAHEFNPKRSESLVSYMSYCRANSKWSHELLAMALYASTIVRPDDVALFIENDIYDWRVFDELAIIAFYLGRKDVTKTMCIKLLHESKVPIEQRERIEKNLQFSI